MSRVTISDVAVAARVSKTAVSFAFNSPEKLGQATLARYSEIVHTGLTEMRGATAPRLLLELLCARMLLPAATVAEPGLLERLERLERRNAITAAPPPAGETGADAPEPAGGRRQFQRPSGRLMCRSALAARLVYQSQHA